MKRGLKRRRRRVRRNQIFGGMVLGVLFVLLSMGCLHTILNVNDTVLGKNKKAVSAGKLKTHGITPSYPYKEFNEKAKAEMHKGPLQLVNANYKSYMEELVLVSVYDVKNKFYFVKDTNVQIDQQMVGPLNKMLEDFYHEEQKKSIMITSGYRTIAYQEELYQRFLKEKGEDYTKRYVANPGNSDHHTGLAIDLGLYDEDTKSSSEFNGKGKYVWFLENAHKYGFVLRYPKEKEEITGIAYEPWHYRYVGVPHATFMFENQLCLEEYLDLVKQYEFGGEHLLIHAEEKRYEVYYYEGTKIPVDNSATYHISGTNIDGFVVTVEL